MPAITPEFTFDLESNMRIITAREYERLLSQLWWQRVTRMMTSSSKKERINWLLDTAKIKRTGKKGGNIEFEDIVAVTYEATNLNAAAGLKMNKNQLEDLDGGGIQAAAHWSRQMGAYAAYWPQKMVAKEIRENNKTYDGKNFFATDHVVNPFNKGAGVYANLFTGAASGSYPGALPIDDSVTIDVAVKNLARALAYIATIPMPNGEDPRFLRVADIIGPPRMTARLQQITNAKFIAQAATGGSAGSADVEAVIRNFGLGQPIEAPELAAAFGGSDTSYYLVMSEITSSELGAMLYVNREPFTVIYHGPQTDAQLARIREFQWTTEGRNVVQPGHPYMLFRGDQT